MYPLKWCLKTGFCLRALLVYLLIGAFGFPVLATALPDPTRLAPDELQVLERELATELLTLNLQLMSLQEDQDRIEEKLAALAASREVEERGLATTKARLEKTRGHLGGWIRYYYEEGRWPLVGMLLQADNMAEFLRRLDFALILIKHESELLNEVRTLDAAAQERLSQIDFLETETRNAKNEISSRMTKLAQFHKMRSELLKSVQERSSELSERLAVLERQWRNSLAPLQNLLGQLNIVLAQDFKPDRVYFRGGKMLVEVSSGTIKRALVTAAGDTGVDLDVEVNADGIMVSGIVAGGQTNFRISGRLIPVSMGKALSFNFENVFVNGLRIDAKSLPFLAENQGAFSLGNNFKFMTIADITHEKGKVRVTLQPK